MPTRNGAQRSVNSSALPPQLLNAYTAEPFVVFCSNFAAQNLLGYSHAFTSSKSAQFVSRNLAGRFNLFSCLIAYAGDFPFGLLTDPLTLCFGFRPRAFINSSDFRFEF